MSEGSFSLRVHAGGVGLGPADFSAGGGGARKQVTRTGEPREEEGQGESRSLTA